MFFGVRKSLLKGKISAFEDGLSGKVSESERIFLEREVKESVERVREREREKLKRLCVYNY